MSDLEAVRQRVTRARAVLIATCSPRGGGRVDATTLAAAARDLVEAERMLAVLEPMTAEQAADYDVAREIACNEICDVLGRCTEDLVDQVGGEPRFDGGDAWVVVRVRVSAGDIWQYREMKKRSVGG